MCPLWLRQAEKRDGKASSLTTSILQIALLPSNQDEVAVSSNWTEVWALWSSCSTEGCAVRVSGPPGAADVDFSDEVLLQGDAGLVPW